MNANVALQKEHFSESAYDQEILDLAALIMEKRLPTETDITSPEVAANYFRHLLGNSDREVLGVALLNIHHIPVRFERVFVGGLSYAQIDIPYFCRLVLSEANCDSIIISHIHTSGKTRPSQSDDMITSALCKAMKAIEVHVIDHIIVAPSNNYYSYFEARSEHLISK